VPLSASRMTFPPREVFDVARRDRSAPSYCRDGREFWEPLEGRMRFSLLY
jgi:hypothetical protein